ncbi:MAG: hypothetical protein C4543_09455 [Ignavibacteriales bacterium]|nr:MAG: hypothetical protein C4543_09455 [Ignavibacteriales bacterium]
MKVRKWVRILHRDIGYLSVGLIIVYGISGIAVNHINDWNPNYIIEKDSVNINILSDSVLTDDAMITHIKSELNISDSVNSFFRNGPASIQLFFNRKTVSANVELGKVEIETVNDRTVFRETNFLHLNNPKKVWTYVADLFAVGLVFLAISGMFMIRGKNGITGRGKYLVAISILIPVLFLIIYF